jgi:uroporphyrinogen-III synthase
LDAVLENLSDYDIAIFTSANAVDFAMRRIAHWPQPGPHIAAVGKASAKALAARGLEVNLQPQSQFNSEALLALPELQQVAQKRIVIFRGVGGRELLAEQLIQRAATVDYAECYQRCLPQPKPQQLQQITQALCAGAIQLVTATSNESLQNLHSLLGNESATCLNQTTIIGVSQRMLAVAKTLQLQHVRIAAQASDQAIVDEILAWREQSQ